MDGNAIAPHVLPHFPGGVSQPQYAHSTTNVPPYLFSLLHDARQVEAREDAPAGGGDACDATVEQTHNKKVMLPLGCHLCSGFPLLLPMPCWFPSALTCA